MTTHAPCVKMSRERNGGMNDHTIAASPSGQPLHAPRGAALACRGWAQEAAMRMLMNSLDPEVAEAPGELILYGGHYKAARDWNCFLAIVASLRELENDQTLLVDGGR